MYEQGNCSNPSKYYYSCTCGEKGFETFDGEIGTEHEFEENLIIDEYPDSTYDGKGHRVCKNCGYKQYETIQHSTNFPVFETYALHNNKINTAYIDIKVQLKSKENSESKLEYALTTYYDYRAILTEDGEILDEYKNDISTPKGQIKNVYITRDTDGKKYEVQKDDRQYISSLPIEIRYNVNLDNSIEEDKYSVHVITTDAEFVYHYYDDPKGLRTVRIFYGDTLLETRQCYIGEYPSTGMYYTPDGLSVIFSIDLVDESKNTRVDDYDLVWRPEREHGTSSFGKETIDLGDSNTIEVNSLSSYFTNNGTLVLPNLQNGLPMYVELESNSQSFYSGYVKNLYISSTNVHTYLKLKSDEKTTIHFAGSEDEWNNYVHYSYKNAENEIIFNSPFEGY